MFCRIMSIKECLALKKKLNQPKTFTSLHIQVNLIITLSLGSMETDRVISEPCYNEVIYNRHIAK